MGDAEDLAGDEEIGVIHRVNQKDVLHADAVAFGDAAEGVALAHGVDNRFWLNDEVVGGGDRRMGRRKINRRTQTSRHATLDGADTHSQTRRRNTTNEPASTNPA